jgi:hypothetical protein
MADILSFYRSEGSRQWRWRYQAEGNSERLANGGEEYHSLEACMESAFRVCDLSIGRNPENVILATGGREFTRGGYSVLVEIEQDE